MKTVVIIIMMICVAAIAAGCQAPGQGEFTVLRPVEVVVQSGDTAGILSLQRGTVIRVAFERIKPNGNENETSGACDRRIARRSAK
jgi:hypothetical protein